MNELVIYTDGGCRGNPGPGAWAFISIRRVSEGSMIDNFYHKESGFDPNTTNNRMEILAVINAIKNALTYEKLDKINLYSDSQYVINTLTKKWKINANKDLWVILNNYLSELKCKIYYHWVKGHSNDKLNQYVDDLVNEEMDKHAKIK